MKLTPSGTVFDWIEQIGVELVYTSAMPPNRLGAYLDDERRILVRPGLTWPLEEETLVHEYCHALKRDRSKHPTIEWRAWRETARILVPPIAYARAESISLDASYIARELGTTTKVIEVYRKAILRGEILALTA